MNLLDFLKSILPIGLTKNVKENAQTILGDAISAMSGSSASFTSTSSRKPNSDRRGSMSSVSIEDTSITPTPETSQVPKSTTMGEDYMSFLTQMLDGFGSKIGTVLNDIFGITSATALNNINNYKMWELNNQYNSPAEQMQRFKDAGLNPNLMYGQGSNGNSSAPASVSEIPQGMSMQMALQSATTGSQIGKTLAEISNIEANTANVKKQTDLLAWTIKKEKQTAENLSMEYHKLRADINKINSEARLNELEAIYKEYINNTLELDYLQRKYNLTETEVRVLQTRANIQKTEAETNNINTRLNMDIWTFNHVDRLDATIKANEAEISNMDKQLKEIYGQSHAATEGMTGIFGNVMRMTGRLVGEAKYGIKNMKKREQKKNN